MLQLFFGLFAVSGIAAILALLLDSAAVIRLYGTPHHIGAVFFDGHGDLMPDFFALFTRMLAHGIPV